MAALEKGVMDPQGDLVNCAGKYWIAPYIKCTGVHGNVDYYKAMAVSCNTYFQEMGRRAGKDEIIKIAKQFGLGAETGIDLPYEASGFLPTPEWKKDHYASVVDSEYNALYKELDKKYDSLVLNAKTAEEKDKITKKKANEKIILDANYKIAYKFNTNWQQFDTFNMSIGQGYNNFTVIQLANYVATIANGGYLMQPHLVKKIVSHEGKVIELVKPHVLNKTDVSVNTIAQTKLAMQADTQAGGTAYALFGAFPPEITVGAKTGTAETGRAGDNAKKEFHGVFIAFAPVEDPQIAFAGIVEYGTSGGASAGYIARDVFEQYFGVKDHLADEEATKNAEINKTKDNNSSQNDSQKTTANKTTKANNAAATDETTAINGNNKPD